MSLPRLSSQAARNIGALLLIVALLAAISAPSYRSSVARQRAVAVAGASVVTAVALFATAFANRKR